MGVETSIIRRSREGRGVVQGTVVAWPCERSEDR